jgi:hypothetical protein
LSDKDAKKPGTRDISDLKARLGLKKQAPRAASQGIVPPAGGKAGYIPPPPGAAAPPPPEPVIPDAKVDPFGAMNAIASQGAQARGPEIIVVNDGKPVEQVEGQAHGTMRAVKIGALIVVPLVLGFVLGGINYDRKRFNNTLEDAKALTEEFTQIGKSLEALNIAILNAKDRGKGGFALFDKDFVAEVDALNFTIVEDEKLIVYQANLYSLDRKLVSDILIFYGRIKQLAQKMKDHQQATKRSLATTTPTVGEKVPGGGTFAVLVKAPTAEEAQKGALPTAELVQVGKPMCPDGKEMDPKAGCPQGPMAGIQFRGDTSAPWNVKGLPTGATDVTDKLLDLRPNVVWSALYKGSAKFLDEAQYYQRLTEIEALTTDLVKDRKDIEDRLAAAAARTKRLAL